MQLYVYELRTLSMIKFTTFFFFLVYVLNHLLKGILTLYKLKLHDKNNILLKEVSFLN